MPILQARTIPNVITVGRILVAPAVFILILTPGFWPRLVAFALFLIAAFSDLIDGHLARKHGWISDFGKLMDPLADKLLLVATFLPFYIVSHRPGPAGHLPYWGELPLWLIVVIFGRELVVTVVRQLEAQRGRVIPAGTAGKYKTVFQNIFSGSAIFWYALRDRAAERGWTGTAWEHWQGLLHGPVVAISLLIALLLTVYSMIVYFRSWRALPPGSPS
ncbi:MAG TPA: CDP-diacylglycerol--glycerol-3-phosphate 3-phosphatidyltransferase [Longimicrobiales bacterium]|nr:CDP-diacylglycerol--glycerol-3-phosphate 3-phosphatidyltransferase [Longimicrobiales bacterium]